MMTSAVFSLIGAPSRCTMSQQSIRGPYGPRSRSLADARSRFRSVLRDAVAREAGDHRAPAARAGRHRVVDAAEAGDVAAGEHVGHVAAPVVVDAAVEAALAVGE